MQTNAVSRPGGAYEQAADRTAAKVLAAQQPVGSMYHELGHVVQPTGESGSINKDVMRAPLGQPSGSSAQVNPNQSVDVPSIQQAAIVLLKEAISKISNVLAIVRPSIELTGRDDVLRQEFPGVDEALPFAGIDRNAASAWTGSGPRTVGLLLERLQTVLNLLESDWIKFVTPEKNATITHCGFMGKPQDLCDKAEDPFAWACRSYFSVLLCPAFIDAGEEDQILTIIHEAAHLAYLDLTHSMDVNLDNAYCIEKIVGELTDTYSLTATAGCQALAALRPP